MLKIKKKQQLKHDKRTDTDLQLSFRMTRRVLLNYCQLAARYKRQVCV